MLLILPLLLNSVVHVVDATWQWWHVGTDNDLELQHLATDADVTKGIQLPTLPLRLRHAAAADAGTSIRHAAAEAAATLNQATDAAHRAQPFAIQLPMLPLLSDMLLKVMN